MKNLLNLPWAHASNKEEGQVALISVLILFAVGVVVTVTGVVTTIDSAKNARIDQNSTEAFLIADGCAEEGYMRYKQSASYAGANLNVGNGSCIINVNANGNAATLIVEATVAEQTRRITANINRSPFSIVTWEETQ